MGKNTMDVPSDRKSVLFISRNYPPMKGGLETYSYNLIQHFERHNDTYKIVLAKTKPHLLWFLPYSFFKALYLIVAKHIKVVHLCDSFLAPLGLMLGKLTGIQVTITAHGLDITCPNPLYQRIIPLCAAGLDRIICVSRSTRAECIRRMIPLDKCCVIPNGVDAESFKGSSWAGKNAIEAFIGKPLAGRKIILYVGRLIKRKGIKWFVSQVMPELDSTYIFIAAGSGPEYGEIKRVVEQRGLSDRVFLMGVVDDETRNNLYRAADMFVMPNITVPGDVEGFGITALEAGINGLPVLASNIQGIRDAVIDGKTGYLLEERCAERFLEKIGTMKMDRDAIKAEVKSTYGWERIYRLYENALFSYNIET